MLGRGLTGNAQPSMARLYKKAPRKGSRVRCAYPGYTITRRFEGRTKTNGEPKLAVCVEAC